MNVDLISALEARAAEAPSGRASARDSEFPNVLRASMSGDDGAEARARRGSSESDRGSRSSAANATGSRESTADESTADESTAREARAGESEDSQESRDSSGTSGVSERSEAAEEQAREARADGGGAGPNEDPESEDSQEAISVAAAGVAAGAIADAGRTSLEAASGQSGGGAPTALEGAASGGPSGDQTLDAGDAQPSREGRAPLGQAEAALAREAVDAAARQTTSRATLRDEEAGSNADDEGRDTGAEDVERRSPSRNAEITGGETLSTASRTSAGAAASGPDASERAALEATTERAELAASPGSESSGSSRDDSGERRSTDPDRAAYDTATRAEEAREFDRALAGAQSGVDPNLRQSLALREEMARAPETIEVAGATSVANPIAGAVTETTPALPGGASPAAASDAISVQTEWLATRGGGTARLVLHPRELGEISIRVTLRDGVVGVVMVAQEAAAHSIAEDQSERLFQALASRDLRMDQFEVRRGDPSVNADGSQGQLADSGAERDGRSPEERRAEQAAGPNEPAARRGFPARREGVPDTPPRILAAGGAPAGVDLRI